ncbi:ABC transporter substrate-binding protein [Diplocloster hominis]|uniref:ABC transporter substrate-binding protein n=1 Tax=Diplocloster hominis TaxID=3079010 RepID=UPI0031BBBEF2
MKKLLVLFLTVCLLSALAACGSTPASNNPADTPLPANPSAGSQESEGKSSLESEAETLANTLPGIDRAGNEIAIPKEIHKIVSLSPGVTELLCDLGLSGQIICVDPDSLEYIADLSADTAVCNPLEPDIPKLFTLSPDIIFTGTRLDSAGASLYKSAEEAGICVAEIPPSHTIGNIEDDIQFVCDCVGKTMEGETIVAEMEIDLQKIASTGRTISDPKTVMLEFSGLPSIQSFGTGVYLNEMLELIGAENALAGEIGWVTLDEEQALEADPDVILTAAAGRDTDAVAEILNRSGWENTTAVQNLEVYAVDRTRCLFPNQHIIEALHEIAKTVYPQVYNDL